MSENKDIKELENVVTVQMVDKKKKKRGRPKIYANKKDRPSAYKKVKRERGAKLGKTPFGTMFKRATRGKAVPPEVWQEIFIKYKTGEYTHEQLANMYNLDQSQVTRKINNYKIKKDENAQEAIRLFDEGFQKISNIINGEDKEEREKMEQMAEKIINGEIEDDETTGTDIVVKEPQGRLSKWDERRKPKEQIQALKAEVIDNANSVKLANEIMDIVSKRNPQFARGFQAVGALMITKMKEILTVGDVGSGDLRNIAQAMRDIDATMSIFPKQPTIAQQFNFGAKQKADEVDKDINLTISVVDKNDKDD